tara:strand:- start:10335 stop:11147 length:813 start_codon:yes stop_codon:yes gene_type:complete
VQETNKSKTNSVHLKRMNRLLSFLFSISLIGCCNEPKLLQNGLTKKASKITEYTFIIEEDSLNNKNKDTLSIIEKKYNENDQIISRHQKDVFADESFDIQYTYNENKKIQQEIVTFPDDSLVYIVDYFYKDTLLVKTTADINNDIFQLIQRGWYQYNSQNDLLEHSSKLIYINNYTNDTILNTNEISTYDADFLIETKLFNYINPERSRTTKYVYSCGLLKKMSAYNRNDSLIAITKYKYQYDKYRNWIARESFENNKLNYIIFRDIDYK